MKLQLGVAGNIVTSTDGREWIHKRKSFGLHRVLQEKQMSSTFVVLGHSKKDEAWILRVPWSMKNFLTTPIR